MNAVADASAGQARTTRHSVWHYSRRGYRVFPLHEIKADDACSCGRLECGSADKHRVKEWQTLATVDAEQIPEWWRQWPTSNIGVACDPESNLTVPDIDPAHLEDAGWHSCCPLANEHNRTRGEVAT